MIKAIVFDCFGVLVTEGWYAFRHQYLKDSAVRQEANDLHRAVNVGMIPYDEFESELHRLSGAPLEIIRSFLDNNRANTPLFEYIREKIAGKYKIGMLSNAGADWLSEMFTPDERKLFDATVLSYQIQAAKPDPVAYQAIADKLGVELAECVFIDDTERFCTGARECGMQAIWFKDNDQSCAELDAILQS